MAAEREALLAAAAAQAREAGEARLVEARREAQALLDGARATLAGEREHVLGEARRAALDLGRNSRGGCWPKRPRRFAELRGSSG